LLANSECIYSSDYGYFLYYPENGTFEGGDEQYYLSDTGVKIVAYGEHSSLNDMKEMSKNIKTDYKSHEWTVTYDRLVNQDLYLSGRTSKGDIYYQKTVKMTSDKYATIRIEYPDSEKEFGDTYIREYIKKFPSEIN
jgi:hypothetical protein